MSINKEVVFSKLTTYGFPYPDDVRILLRSWCTAKRLTYNDVVDL